jgi:RNA polymerase sigma-70 factor, ECF subfamily
MTTPANNHKILIEESIARLLSRAANSRGRRVEDLFPRVSRAVEKYVMIDAPNVSNAEIRDFIDSLSADDLCLIVSCEMGDEAAWNDMVAGFDTTVKSAARRFAGNTEETEDLASSIWAELYGMKRDAEGNIKTKLAYYSGRGSLAGWLRAVVSQLAVDQFRKDAKFVQIEEMREFENLAQESAAHSENPTVVHAAENPEDALSRKQSQSDVSAALKESIAGLAPEDRLILKLYYFDGLKLKDIGVAFGFHEATASRKVERIQKELRRATEKCLTSQKGWKQDEVNRFLADTAAHLDVGLEKMFVALLCAALAQEFLTRSVQ